MRRVQPVGDLADGNDGCIRGEQRLDGMFIYEAAEVDAFGEAMTAPAADPAAVVAATVDRLLASPHFGERMASDWLDVARFADTFGYQSDATMQVWPWRDWVIRSFNENLPFDQFITWQLAGDLLPGATRDQQLATAFNRLPVASPFFQSERIKQFEDFDEKDW